MAKFKTTAGGKRVNDSLEPLRTQFPEGSVIFAEGDLGLAMYVIETGEVEVRKRLGTEEKTLVHLGKGDFFGEMCMLDEETPRSATAIAVTDVNLVTIDQSAFTFILTTNPEIAVRMMRKLAIRLRQTTDLLEEAVGHEVQLESSANFGKEKVVAKDPNARVREISTGMVFPLAEKRETTVGRVDPVTGIHPDIDLTPVDTKRSISRRHARMRRDEDGSYSVIEDVGTMNGTFVNGVRLTAGRPVPVASGDSVVFGTIQCQFELDEGEE